MSSARAITADVSRIGALASIMTRIITLSPAKVGIGPLLQPLAPRGARPLPALPAAREAAHPDPAVSSWRRAGKHAQFHSPAWWCSSAATPGYSEPGHPEPASHDHIIMLHHTTLTAALPALDR